MKPKKVGEINDLVINILNLPIEPFTPIFVGRTNLEHMLTEHPSDYHKYAEKLEEILNNPDNIAKHPKRDSIEYIKVFYNNEGKNDYVLVAVRASKTGIYYARTLFIMGEEKVRKYKTKNALKQIKKP